MGNTSKKTIASNVLWNTCGSLYYLFAQWILSVLVVRMAGGYSDAGILSLAMSLSNVFAIMALFNVRNFQASDSEGQYSSSQYVFHRVVTCFGALCACAIFVLVNNYNLVTSLAIIAYMLVKLVESFADVLHGIAQKGWRLDIAGKSFFARGTLLLASFCLTYYFSGNLVLAIFAMAFTTLAALLLIDVNLVRRVDRFHLKADFKAVKSLTLKCLPFVCYGVALNLIMPFARYMIELKHGEEKLGYYASISTIVVLIQAFITLVFTPLIGIFEDAHIKRDYKKIAGLFVKFLILLSGITLLAILASTVAGEFFMSLIFGEEIRDYVYLLYPNVIASALISLAWFMGMILVVIRDSKTLLISSLCGAVLGIIISVIVIPNDAYFGANLATIVALALISVVYIIRFIIYIISVKQQENHKYERL